MPNSDKPILKDWLDAIFSKNWEFSEESILIDHSSGATLILRILENLPKSVKINKVILVAGPLDKGSIKKFWKYKENLTKSLFDWDKIKNSAQEFVLFYADNDPYDCGIRHGVIIHSKVGGKLIIKKGQGHFNLEVGEKYRQFPEILEYV